VSISITLALSVREGSYKHVIIATYVVILF